MSFKTLPTVLLLLVVSAMVGVQGFYLYRMQVTQEQDYRAPALMPQAAASVTLGLEQIANLQLFGNADTVPVVESVPKELPKTDLQLVLVGSITNTDSQQSSALVQSGKDAAKRYFLGDEIAEGVVLHEVRKDEVVLKRDNRFETLGFPRSVDTPPPPIGYGLPRQDADKPGVVLSNKGRPQPARPQIVEEKPSTPPRSAGQATMQSSELLERANQLRQWQRNRTDQAADK